MSCVRKCMFLVRPTLFFVIDSINARVLLQRLLSARHDARHMASRASNASKYARRSVLAARTSDAHARRLTSELAVRLVQPVLV